MVKNIVALGALQAATNLFPPETFVEAVRQALKDKPKVIPSTRRPSAGAVSPFPPPERRTFEPEGGSMADVAGAEVTSVDEQLCAPCAACPPRPSVRCSPSCWPLAREPHCAESQADGVPCPTAHNACDQCYRYEEFRSACARGSCASRPRRADVRLPRELIDISPE